MIEFLEIYDFELRSFIEAAYEDDEELLTKYHVDNFNLDEAVDETLRMINITSIGLKMRHYGVVSDGEKIGYFSFFQNNLYSFAVHIDYRIKEVLSVFWENIVENVGDSFVTVLYPNNTRAISWLKKCGMVEVKDVEEGCVTLLKVKQPIMKTTFSEN